MLGKIFESLVLQIEQSGTGGKSLRHDTGSHYTPRPIVHYLCVGALAAWLEKQPPFAPGSAGILAGVSQPTGQLAGKDAGAPRAARIAQLLALDASEGLDDDARRALGALEPLPNLDFKIRRADSLVDKIHGEPMELGKLARETGAALPLSKLTTAKHAFFHARTAAEKRQLRLDICQAITELAKLELTRARTDAAGMGLALDEKSTRRVVEWDHGLKEIAFISRAAAASPGPKRWGVLSLS